MHELSWWYLYIQILNTEATRRKEVHDIIEALLPWINPELWAAAEKQKGMARENVDFDNQLRAMFDGTWQTDPDATQQPFIDDIQVGTPDQGSLVGQLFGQQGSSPPAQQSTGSIRGSVFPNMPPSFKGVVEGSPDEVADQFTPQVPVQPEADTEEELPLRPMINPNKNKSIPPNFNPPGENF